MLFKALTDWWRDRRKKSFFLEIDYSYQYLKLSEEIWSRFYTKEELSNLYKSIPMEPFGLYRAPITSDFYLIKDDGDFRFEIYSGYPCVWYDDPDCVIGKMNYYGVQGKGFEGQFYTSSNRVAVYIMFLADLSKMPLYISGHEFEPLGRRSELKEVVAWRLRVGK